MGSAMGNIADMASKPLAELTPMQQAGKGLMGGVGGGLSALGKRQQQQPGGGGGAPPIGIAPPPTYDFSQVGQPKKNPFYGGY